MRTNGFIFIALMLAVGSRAGSPWYLPSVGPVAIRLARVTTTAAADLPEPIKSPDAPVELIPDIPVDSGTNELSTAATLLTEPPVIPAPEPVVPLIGPMMETNMVVTPQMLLRFFAPATSGASRETIVIPQTGFTPARPPAQSSTVNYSQPKR